MMDSVVRLAIALVTLPVLLAAQGVGDKAQRMKEHAHQAQVDLETKRPDLAIGEFRRILDLDPDNLEVRGNVGVLEYFQGQYAGAASDLRAVLRAKPDLWKLRTLLGMSEKRIGENAKAQSDLEAAFPQLDERKLKIQAGLELVEADYALNDLGKACQTVNVLRQMEPADPDILYASYRVYSELSNEAMLSLTMVAPDSARMHQLMAHELARQAHDDAAIANYREALKIDPTRADIHYELAEILYTESSARAQAEAKKEFEAALAANPADEKSLCGLGEIAVRRSDLKMAREYFSRALEMQPEDADASLGMARVLMSMHEPREAAPYLERAAQVEPFNASTHYRLGVVYREIGRTADAGHELAEFEKLKKMKARLNDIYQQTRLSPGKAGDRDSDVP